METNSLISILVALLVIFLVILFILLFILLFTLVLKKIKENSKALEVSEVPEVVQKHDFNNLKETIGDYLLSKKEILDALDILIEHHGEIPEKIGKKLSPIFDEYVEILHSICVHPETDDAVVLEFERNLSRLNPTYRRDIIEAIFIGLKLKKATKY